MKNKQKKPGFTLIELLVTIVIIGILATISISTFNEYQKKAQTAKAESNLKELINAIVIARVLDEKLLKDITGSTSTGWSSCVNTDLRNSTGTCFNKWKAVLKKIEKAANMNLSHFERDSWGSPYILDENEGEWSSNYCRKDTVMSVGPDGRNNYPDTADEDDIIFTKYLPFFNSKKCGA